MDITTFILLILSGALGGFIGGLIGIGGGVIFAPVLLIYYQVLGVPESMITPLTLATSSFCVIISTAASTIAQQNKQMINWHIATITGLVGAVAMYAVTHFVSTQTWYDKHDFQLVFGFILLLVVFRMVFKAETEGETSREGNENRGLMASVGIVSGAVAALAGIGGGVILVPAYNRLLKLPLKMASGTSNGTILYTSVIGIISYIVSGWHKVHLPQMLPFTMGYIDLVGSLLISVPTLFTARLGVAVAQRLDTTWLRRIFSIIAFLLAMRLLWSGLH